MANDNKNTNIDIRQDPKKLIGQLIGVQMSMLGPYRKGVEKALKESGYNDALQAKEQGVSWQQIEQQADLSPEHTVSNVSSNIPQEEIDKRDPDGLITQLLNSKKFIPAKNAFQKADITSEGIQEGGWLSWIGGNDTGSLLKKMIVLSNIQNNAQTQNNLSPEAQMATLLKTKELAEQHGIDASYGVNAQGVPYYTVNRTANTLTPEEIEPMAQQMINGNLVPAQLSRIQRAQVISRATQIDPNYSPVEADINFYSTRVGSAALEKLYNNVTSFEDTFRRNAAVALDLSEKFDRTKIPLLNRAIQAGQRNIAGDPEASKMLVALYTVATEYARLTSSPGATGSAITDSAREEALGMINSWMSKGQIRGMLDPDTGIMSIDANNRIAALEEAKKRQKERINPKKNNRGNNGIPTFKTEEEAETSGYKGEAIVGGRRARIK